MSDKFHIPHIKRHTEGAYNELSFDVLDAASNELDGKKKGFFGRRKDKKSPDTVKPTKSQMEGKKAAGSTAPTLPVGSSVAGGTPAPVAAPAASRPNLSPADEINQRKRTRRAHTWRIRILVAIIVVGLVAGIAMLAYQQYKQREDYATRFTALVSEFVEIDKTTVTVDGLMANPFSEESAELRDSTRESFDAVRARLAHVQTESDQVALLASETRDESVLEQVKEAARGRERMFDAAEKAFDLSDEALWRIGWASSIWANVMDADQKARAAAAAANEASDEDTTRAAYDMTADAQGAFENALYDLYELQGYFGDDLDLSSEIEYLELRVEALDYALATADALLEGDRETATENNDAYNKAEQQAAKMAESLPFTLEEPIRAYYDAAIKPILEAYDTARQDVSAADAIIRDYLGERGK